MVPKALNLNVQKPILQFTNSDAFCQLQQQSPTFLAPGTGFVEDNFSMDGARGGWVGGSGDGSGNNASDGDRCGVADEASLAHWPLPSCCAVRFLTGLRPVPVRDPGVGDSCVTVICSGTHT